MDNTVEMNAPEVAASEAQVVNAPDVGGEEVSVSDYMGSAQTPEPKAKEAPATAESVENTEDDAPLPNVTNAKDFQKALRERLPQERKRGRSEIENSPEMKYVRALIEDRAREKGITPEAALKELNDERINKKAEQYGKNPASWFKDQMLQQQQTQEPSRSDAGYRIANGVARAMQEQRIPEGFDPHNPGNEFFADADQYGVDAALVIWELKHAPQVQAEAKANKIAEALDRRQKAAAPMSPTTANPQSSRSVDYMNMSSDEFRRLDEQLMRAARAGKKVRG